MFSMLPIFAAVFALSSLITTNVGSPFSQGDNAGVTNSILGDGEVAAPSWEYNIVPDDTLASPIDVQRRSLSTLTKRKGKAPKKDPKKDKKDPKKQSSEETKTIIGYFDLAISMSAKCNLVIERITLLTIAFEGFRVAQCLAGIAVTIPKATAAILSMRPVNDGDACLIINVFRNFVKIHQQLLATVISKKGLMGMFGFVEPIRLALVAIEAVVDKFALGVVDKVPTQKPEGEKCQKEIKESLGQAIKVYS